MTRSFPRFRNTRPLTLTAAVLGLGIGLAASTSEAAVATPFLAHQALYDLSLVKSSSSSSVSSVRGRILYSFSGNACDGYTSEFRQVSEMESGEDDNVTLSDLRSDSYEDAAG